MTLHTRGTRLGTNHTTVYTTTSVLWKPDQKKTAIQHGKRYERGMWKYWGVGSGCQETELVNVQQWEVDVVRDSEPVQWGWWNTIWEGKSLEMDSPGAQWGALFWAQPLESFKKRYACVQCGGVGGWGSQICIQGECRTVDHYIDVWALYRRRSEVFKHFPVSKSMMLLFALYHHLMKLVDQSWWFYKLDMNFRALWRV